MLNIKDPETHALARQVAKETGETLTKSVNVALRERLDRLQERRRLSTRRTVHNRIEESVRRRRGQRLRRCSARPTRSRDAATSCCCHPATRNSQTAGLAGSTSRHSSGRRSRFSYPARSGCPGSASGRLRPSIRPGRSTGSSGVAGDESAPGTMPENGLRLVALFGDCSDALPNSLLYRGIPRRRLL